MRRRRARGWIIVAVVALLGLFITVDVVALQYFESRGGAQLARGLAAEHATVDFGNVPFLHEYLRGRRSEVAVEVTGATAGGLRVANLAMRFSDARFSSTSLFRLTRSRYATRAPIEGADPDLRIEIAEADLDNYIRARLPSVARVEILETGVEVTFRGPDDDNEEAAEDEAEEQEDRVTARYLPRVERVSDSEDSEERQVVLRLVGEAGLPRWALEDARDIQGLLDLPAVPEDLRTDQRLFDRVLEVRVFGSWFEIEIGEGGTS